MNVKYRCPFENVWETYRVSITKLIFLLKSGKFGGKKFKEGNEPQEGETPPHLGESNNIKLPSSETF